MSKSLNLFGGSSKGGAHTEARRELLQAWSKDCWAFLTGRDVDDTPMVITQDELADKPYRPFPTDRPYLKALLNELLDPAHKVVLVDKSRQMMVSTLCMLILYWMILFQKGRRCYVSKQTEDLAIMLMEQKVRGVHRRAPIWFQNALPLSMKPAEKIIARATGSEIVGVAQNAALRHFKGNTATVVLIDEAAVQEYFPDMLQAAMPMAGKVWAVTTAYHGNPGASAFYRLKTEV